MRSYSVNSQQVIDALTEAALSTPVSKLVPPPLPEPITNDVAETPDGTEDLAHAAFDYIESEVGRLDWERNWPAYKNRHGEKVRERVASWLRHFEMDHDPDSIVKFIDDYHTMHKSEKWL